ncbi:MAG: methyltransferase domain-containing protein [Chitinophagaceae bacterium]|nr:MAG: methyltransferase domain-containing protein [Chitinophagaceae bacterium]
MRRFVRYLLNKTYKPVLESYLSKTSSYRYKTIKLEIHPGVFHPGFFFSTKFLLEHLSHEKLKDQSVLELGAGSGLISIYAALQGALVTATDINPVAVKCIKRNIAGNSVSVEVLQSDLFGEIPVKPYKYVLLNPPFYKKNPESLSQYAWYCGENGEYFHNLFASLDQYIGKGSKVYMVVCESCDLELIKTAAKRRQFRMQCVATRSRFLEKHYIFNIESC